MVTKKFKGKCKVRKIRKKVEENKKIKKELNLIKIEEQSLSNTFASFHKVERKVPQCFYFQCQNNSGAQIKWTTEKLLEYDPL